MGECFREETADRQVEAEGWTDHPRETFFSIGLVTPCVLGVNALALCICD